MLSFTSSQQRLLADFFSNMAVVWLAASFIGATNPVVMLQGVLSGLLSLLISLKLIKEAEAK